MTHGKGRIFVSIAVSRPAGGLDPLPGAITAATRMAGWARSQGYETLLLHDGDLPEITVDVLRHRITEAIQDVQKEATLARLVVFFAGHGATLDAIGDQYWILTHWDERWTEAIKVSAFQRMLEYYGPQQVSIIGDACQEFSSRFMNLIGSAVLDRPDEAQRQYELDQFYAADVGKQAFMIKAKGQKGDFCLFTEVLLDALKGDARPPSLEEIDGHKYVTSQSLALYLKEHVALEAGKYGIRMDPRPKPGFYTDRTYLSLSGLPGKPSLGRSRMPGEASAEQANEASDDIVPPRPSVRKLRLIKSKALRAEFDARIKAKRLRNDVFGVFIPEDLDNDDDGVYSPLVRRFVANCGICVDRDVAAIEASFGKASPVDHQPSWFRITPKDDQPDRLRWSDTLVTLADGRIVHACAVDGFVAVLRVDVADLASVFHRSGGNPSSDDLDTYYLIENVYAGRIMGEAISWATLTQSVETPINPTLSCVLAQYYDAMRDVDGLRSLAAAHAIRRQPVPLDIVLYGGGRISGHQGRLYADIPAVTARSSLPPDAARRRPHIDTPAFDKYPIAGRIPWMRATWDAIETAAYDETAYKWRERARAAMVYLAPGKATTIQPEGRDALRKLAGVAVARQQILEPILTR